MVAGDPISASDGLIARGLRQSYFADATGAQRAVDMLMAKLAGDAFTTEYRMPEFDRVDPAPPVADARRATIALVTSGGIVPRGNPDCIESASASKYGAYPLAGLAQLSAQSHQSLHGGYDPTCANADPNRVLPLDDPTKYAEEELAIRRELLQRAITALESDVEQQTVFDS